MNKISQLRQEVTALINKEIEYISGFFHYNLKQFFNSELVYFHAIFAFFEELKGGDAKEGRREVSNRLSALVPLVVGIELLSIGLNVHSFDIDGLKGLGPDKKNASAKEKKYTVELLFGDIFYSRAVIYLLDFGDNIVFDEILASLKTVHKSRLALHHSMLGSTDNGLGIIEKIKDRPPFFYGMGELLKTSLLIGMMNVLPEAGYDKIGGYYEAISLVVILKTYSDMEKLFFQVCHDSNREQGRLYFKEARSKMEALIQDCIEKAEAPLFRRNCQSLSEILT